MLQQKFNQHYPNKKLNHLDNSSSIEPTEKFTESSKSQNKPVTTMQRTLTYLLTAILLSFFAVQCNDISDPGEIKTDPSQEDQLEKPELLSPTNGSDDQNISVELTWEKIRGAKQYEIHISKNENLDSLITEETTTGTSYTADSLAESTTYHWKVRPLNRGKNKTGPWSDTWQFTTVSESDDPLEEPTDTLTVNLQSPENGTKVSTENIPFEWSSVSGANEYNYQISLDSEFNKTVKDTLVESTSLEIAELREGENYHWRVSAVSDSAATEWSQVWQITTQTEASEDTTAEEQVTVNLTSPENEAVVSYENVSFEWSSVSEATGYNYQLSLDSEFTNPVEDVTVESTSIDVSDLNSEENYFWRVKPVTDSAPAEWSQVWQVTTEAKTSEDTTAEEQVTVNLTSPENEAVVSYENVSFEWSSVSEATGYNYQLSLDSEFTNPVEDVTVESTSIDVSDLNSEENYFWRVKPVTDSAPTEWSQVWQVTTEAEPVPAVTLVAPSDGSTHSNPLTVEWDAISGINEYQLQVATDNSFTSPFADEIVSGTSFEIDGTEKGQTYYWRVQAAGDNDSENWSQVWSFDTEAEEIAPDPGNGSFVSVANGDFHVDGQPFRYAGTNAYYLQTYESIDPSVVDRAMNAFENAGVTVVRMWGFYDGPAKHSGDAPLQPEAGVYSEENLKLLDKVIAKGKEKGIRFIIALANYWSELGGICEYNKWAGVPESEACSNSTAMDYFINGSEQQKYYKDYVEMILNRVNTETGVAYKDEPAIFSWEIINEGRNPGGNPQELRDWYQEIAQFIKSIDSNHLVSTGEEGFEENTPAEYSKDQYSNTYVLRAQLGTSFISNTDIPEIDYGSAHWYPGDWGWSSNNQDLHNAQRAWLSDHADIAESMGKPLLIGEYGYAGWGDSNVEEIYSEFWKHAESIQLDGSLLWQLTADHVKCYEFGGNICWPGGRADETLYNGFINHIQAIESQ